MNLGDKHQGHAGGDHHRRGPKIHFDEDEAHENSGNGQRNDHAAQNLVAAVRIGGIPMGKEQDHGQLGKFGGLDGCPRKPEQLP